MNSHIYCKTAIKCESLTTLAALIWLLPCMNSHMYIFDMISTHTCILMSFVSLLICEKALTHSQIEIDCKLPDLFYFSYTDVCMDLGGSLKCVFFQYKISEKCYKRGRVGLKKGLKVLCILWKPPCISIKWP